MGGKSSSKSASNTYQYDNRIAATDSAIVLAGGSSLTLADPGLVDLAKSSLTMNEKILLEVLEGAHNLSIESYKTIGENADKAFEFADKARQDEENRTARTLIPWLVAGASVYAISWAIRGR